MSTTKGVVPTDEDLRVALRHRVAEGYDTDEEIVASVTEMLADEHPEDASLPGRIEALADAVFGARTAEDRRALRESFLAAAPGFRAERDSMRADFGELAQGLRADPWDRAAAEAILVRQGERGRTRLEQGRALFLDYVASLGPEARRALADRIEASLTRHGRMRSGD